MDGLEGVNFWRRRDTWKLGKGPESEVRWLPKSEGLRFSCAHHIPRTRDWATKIEVLAQEVPTAHQGDGRMMYCGELLF